VLSSGLSPKESHLSHTEFLSPQATTLACMRTQTAILIAEFVGMLDEDEADAFVERTQELREQFDDEILGSGAQNHEA